MKGGLRIIGEDFVFTKKCKLKKHASMGFEPQIPGRKSIALTIELQLHHAGSMVIIINYLTLHFAAKPSRIINFGLGVCDFGSEEIQNNTQVVSLQSLVE